ncbi:hypothetical protein [Streptomyces sp. NPDC047024]|uniref:hypothetical protein n=1 Tax=Streptomyces sp. NPDC047024 TaxID=3155476 RepID=UPI0033CF6A03
MTMNRLDVSTDALLTDPRMGPRPPKPVSTARLRYVLQWLWFPALWALWLVPYLVLVFLYFTVLFPFAFVWDLDLPAPPGTGRRLRTRRRLWLNRARLRRECSADEPWLEDQFRALLDGRAPVLQGRQSSGTTWRHRDGRVEIDDSYYARLGVARAVRIAETYGWHTDERGLSSAPRWIVFRAR